MGLCGFLYAMRSLFHAALVVATTVAALAVGIDKRRGFLCPRCKKRFGDKWEFPWLRRPERCQHCGLPFGAERDPDGKG